MIPIDLKGRRALITGGDSGLGAATAKSLAQAGADIAVVYRDGPENAEKVAAAATAFGGRTAIVRLADVADRNQVTALFQWMDREFGGIDILVNNAGMDGARALCAEGDPTAWRRVLEVDLFGAYYCAREAVGRMGRQKRGVVVNTTSVHEFIPWAGYSAYTSAKAGLSMFSKTLAQEVAGQGVRVVAVAPGAIKTPINANVWDDPKGLADLDAKIPMNRVGEPDEIGHVIAFLCSDLAGYMTGVTVAVDGGMLLYPDFRHGG
ncbi:MAG: SDR family oxidoreductase [Alphaproteobacteria bacterium]|nr:SDR family oxidoreductase [Alphaproteobacteria bacterium]MDE2109842.1 SDR family oxidoreductase [Alphaproteobacteria bacterium]MDE2493526.1 SDR family oxidoreductase [Alphaproteobacteria bacterium]